MADTTAGDAAATAGAAKDVTEDKKQPTVEEDTLDVPDPDEDDLDDLDDMLEEFSAAKIDSKKPAAPSGPGRPTTAPGAKDEDASLQDVLTDDDFAKQLTSGMAELLGEIQNTPQMQTQFEAMFKEIAAAADTEAGLDAAAVPVAASSSPKPAAAKPEDIAATEAAEASFQETIKRTMERMRASGDQATASAAAEAEAEGGPDDLLADLLKHMQSSGLDGLEGGGEEEFSKMLMGMMEQLTNKDILYEPMKELDEKFPAWLERNKGTTSEEDLKRYEEQHGIAKEIVAKFEETTYKDSNPKDRETIVNLMQKMQALGSPPADLVGDMPSAQGALNGPLNGPDESCNPQ